MTAHDATIPTGVAESAGAARRPAELDVQELPPVHVQRGGEPAFVGRELMYAITAHIERHPRSHQAAIGPSELGHPCARRIGYKLLRRRALNPRHSWKATIGTAVHAWLERAVDAENADTKTLRYLTEQTVCVGELGGLPVNGHCDLYDRVTAGVIDWKIVGDSQLRDYKVNGPGGQYRTQAHLYGRGLRRLGFPVDWVAVYFLPRNEELDRAVWWSEPYDEQIALDALQRVEGIHLATTHLGVAALANLPTADAYCHLCPYFKANSTDLSAGCPGDPDRETPAQTAALSLAS